MSTPTVEQFKTKWLHIPGSIIIEKDEIKECHLTNYVADLYNISCTIKDEKRRYILPESVLWKNAADVLSYIHSQLTP